MTRRQGDCAFRNDEQKSRRRRVPARLTFDRLEERQLLDAALGSEILAGRDADVSGSRPPTALADAARIGTSTILIDNYNDQGILASFTVKVVADSGDDAPVGLVVLNIDGVYRSPVNLVAGDDGVSTVKIIPSGLPVGDHTVFASFRGGYLGYSAEFSISVSPTAVKTIESTGNRLPLNLTVLPIPAKAGDTLKLRMDADLYSEWTIPSGTVSFYDGDRLLGTASVSGDVHGEPIYTPIMGPNGEILSTSIWPSGFVTYTYGGATLDVPVASVGGGEHEFTAVYSGDTTYAPRTDTASATIYAPPLATSPSGDGTQPVNPPPPSTAGPQVAGVERFGYHMSPTSVVVQFNGSLDPARAQNPLNYRLTNALGRPLRIRSAVYDAVAHTVTLSPAQRLGVRRHYQLAINGATENGVSSPSGLLLDGDADGIPGGNYAVRLDRHNLLLPLRHPVTRRRLPVHPAHPQPLHHPLAHHPRAIRPMIHHV